MIKWIFTLALGLSAHSSEYLIMYKGNDKSITSSLGQDNFVGRFPYPTYKVTKLPSSFSNNKDLIIDENFEITLNSLSLNDPKLPLQWGIQNLGNNEPRRGGGTIPIPGVIGSDINILNIWKSNPGKKEITIAVVDTGIDYNHEDLKENMWINTKEHEGKPGVDDDGNGYVDDIYGYNFSANKSDPLDDNMHGTHVAGIIGARHNDKGVAGVVQNASLMAVKFMDKKGRGNLEKALKATKYAVENGARVVNNSWGSLGHSKILQEYMSSSEDVVFISAAGNNYKNLDESPLYPAAFNIHNMITVAATSPENRMTGFSCYGPKTVHIAAPGRNIISTVLKNKYAVLSGTSMSAPYITGAVALALAKNPRLTPLEIRNHMVETANYIPHLKEKIMSEGIIDMENFLEL